MAHVRGLHDNAFPPHLSLNFEPYEEVYCRNGFIKVAKFTEYVQSARTARVLVKRVTPRQDAPKVLHMGQV